jgi:hypothetical protein
VAAHTGARRIELLRTRVEDFNFESKVVLLREMMKGRGRETLRTVDITPLVESVMRDYFADGHPGGAYAFSIGTNRPIRAGTSDKAFRAVLRKLKWEVLRG